MRIAPLKLERERKAPDDRREKKNEDIFCLAFLHTDCPRRCGGAFREIHPYFIRFVRLCQFPCRKIGKSEKSTVRRPRFFV